MKLELRIPPLVVTVIAGGLGWIIAQTFPGLRPESVVQARLAITLVLLGVVSTVLGVISFRRARTTVNPLQPAGATTLVVSGVYRVTRNPMYLGFLLLLLGEIAWFASPVALLVVPAFIVHLNRFQIAPEEEALRTRFGHEYFSYTARVRRWL